MPVIVETQKAPSKRNRWLLVLLVLPVFPVLVAAAGLVWLNSGAELDNQR